MSRESVTKEVRALLDSTPKGLTTREIENDYRNLCSGNLAASCHRIGFPSISSFLHSLVDNGSLKCEHGLFRAGLGDSSTAHIQQLVSKQRSDRDRRNRGRRSAPPLRSGGGMTVVQPRQIRSLPLQIQNNILDVLRVNPGTMSLSTLLIKYKNKHGAELNYRGYNFTTLKEAVGSIQYINVLEENHHTVIELQQTSQPKLEVNSGSEELKTNIRKVLSSCPPTGIYMTKIASEYKKTTGKTLNPHQQGYSTIIELMDSLSDVVDMTKHESGDWIISDINNRSSQSGENRDKKKSAQSQEISNIEQLIFSQPDGVYLARFNQLYKMRFGKDLNIAPLGYSDISTLIRELYNVDIINAKYGALVRKKSEDEPDDVDSYYSFKGAPTDFVGVEGRYTSSPVPPIGQPVSVKISHIYNPTNFYIQIMRSSNTGNALEELMDNLARCYTPLEKSSNTEVKLATDLCTVGQLCVCRYPVDTNWHRAVITSVLNSTQVKVQFVDYGTQCRVEKNNLYFLRYAYLTFPALSQRASLQGVKPADGVWTPAAGKALLSMTANKNIEAVLHRKERQQDEADILIVSLKTQVLGVNIDLADYLVTSQLALATNQTKISESNDLEKLEKMIDWGPDSDSDSDHADVYEPIRAQTSHVVPPTKLSEPIKAHNSAVAPPTSPSKPITVQKTLQIGPEESTRAATVVNNSPIKSSSQTLTPHTQSIQSVETQLESADLEGPPPLESSCDSFPYKSQFRLEHDTTIIPQSSSSEILNEESTIKTQPPPLTLPNQPETRTDESTLDHTASEFIPSLIPAPRPPVQHPTSQPQCTTPQQHYTTSHQQYNTSQQHTASYPQYSTPPQQYATSQQHYTTSQQHYTSQHCTTPQQNYPTHQSHNSYPQPYVFHPSYQQPPHYQQPGMMAPRPAIYPPQYNMVPVASPVPYIQTPIVEYHQHVQRVMRPAFTRQPATKHQPTRPHGAFRPITPHLDIHTVKPSDNQSALRAGQQQTGGVTPSKPSPIEVKPSLQITIRNDRYKQGNSLSSEQSGTVQKADDSVVNEGYEYNEISEKGVGDPPPLVETDDNELLIIMREQLARLYLLKKRRELRREQKLTTEESLSGCEGSSSDEDLISDPDADLELKNKIENLSQQIKKIQMKIKERISKTDSMRGLQQIINNQTQTRGRGRLLKFLNEVQSAAN